MIELRDRFHLTLKEPLRLLQCFGVGIGLMPVAYDFDSDLTWHTGIFSEIDFAHAALLDQTNNTIMP